MNIDIRLIEEKYYSQVHRFQCEYLDQESFEDFTKRVQSNPDFYFIALDGDEPVGVCYGHPSKRSPDEVVLQGIAVNLDVTKAYARRGIGSKLIEAFQKAAAKKGFRKIGFGAADDLKVEKFYLKNGFKAVELVAKDSNYREITRVKVDDYESGKSLQQQLREQYRPREVIFIFEKIL
mgnify:CR=1 FL=1